MQSKLFFAHLDTESKLSIASSELSRGVRTNWKLGGGWKGSGYPPHQIFKSRTPRKCPFRRFWALNLEFIWIVKIFICIKLQHKCIRYHYLEHRVTKQWLQFTNYWILYDLNKWKINCMVNVSVSQMSNFNMQATNSRAMSEQYLTKAKSLVKLS